MKEKLLEVYVSCFCSQQNQEEKETVDRDCQTDPKWCFTVDMGCQTDVSTTLTEYPTDTPQGKTSHRHFELDKQTLLDRYMIG